MHPVPRVTETPARTTDTARQERRFARSALRELQTDIDALLKSRDVTNAHIGISVISAETGESVYRENHQKNFIPASTLKLFTTAAALDFLGKDFSYCTRLYLDGIVQKSGEFHGNVIIRGAGDPTWSSSFNVNPTDIFEAWAQKLDSLGITSIKGNIIGDDSYFEGSVYAPGWMWDDMTFPYSAQISAISSGDNKIDITVMPGAIAGDAAKITVKNDHKFVRIINSIITVSGTDIPDITTVRQPNSNVIELRGRMPIAGKGDRDPYTVSVTIDNPTQFTINQFKNILEDHGIKIRGAVLDIDDWNERINYTVMQPVAQHFSPTILSIINVINRQSHNLCAESLLKTLGKETSGVGSFEKGVEYVKKFLMKNGISTDDMTMVDGSGLSRLNLCTPHQLTQLLWLMNRGECRQEFASSLASPGESGTMRTRVLGTLAEKRLRAKTGSMNNVSTLAGYVTTRDNETLCFAIMMNNFTVQESIARNLQDLITMRLASFSRKN